MTARLSAEQEFGDDRRIAIMCDGDGYLRDLGSYCVGSLLFPLRVFLGPVDNPMHRPTP